MEVLAGILGIVMQLAFFGVIAWAIVRLLGRRREEGEEVEVDRATSVRRLFVYGLMLVTLILGAVGATMIGRTILTSSWSDDERTALALGLAFMLVAGPAYAFLLRFARSRLRDDDGERTSLAWAAYLNSALASSLIVSTVTVHNFLAGVFGVDDFEWRGIAPVIVWAAVWAMHWFWLRPAHGLPGDLHLAVGSLTGLVTMMIGLGGVIYVAGDEIYASVVERAAGRSRVAGTRDMAHRDRGRRGRVGMALAGVLPEGRADVSLARVRVADRHARWSRRFHLVRRHDRLLDRRLVPRQPEDGPAQRTLRARTGGHSIPGGRDGHLAVPPNRPANRRLRRPVRTAQNIRLSDGGFRSRRDRRGCHARARRTVRVDRRPDHRGPVRRREPA